MADVHETLLPGIGVRHEFTTAEGDRVAVLTHRTGRRELAVYGAEDPDACVTVLHLSSADTRTLSELLGATQVSEALVEVQHQVEGLAIEWVRVASGSQFAHATIADGQFRSRTGASIVAVARGETTTPAPEPDFRFAPGDVVVAVGTPDGLRSLRDLLAT